MSTKYFRAKADKGWSKNDIIDLALCFMIELPVSKVTDADCQWFADHEFTISQEGLDEEYQVDCRYDLIKDLKKRITKRRQVIDHER